MGNSESISTRRLYTSILAETVDHGPPGGIRGVWLDGQPADELARALRDALNRPDANSLKTSARSRLIRADIFGRDTAIKHFPVNDFAMRMKYLLRVSRGRRAWAAGRTLQTLALPTPEPYGYVEIRENGRPIESFYCCAFLPDAVEARAWIRPWYHRQTPDIQQAVRVRIAELLLDLYRNRVYHADTKTRNLLLRDPLDADRRAFYWIDLECLRFGKAPTRRQVLRNLVQLNGSIGSKVSEEDRMAFLRDLARAYPWLNQPRVADTIRKQTRRRLERELRGEDGA